MKYETMKENFTTEKKILKFKNSVNSVVEFCGGKSEK